MEVMEFQQSYLKAYKMMLLKCCTQYVSKFGKSSSGYRTGKGRSSSQFPRRAVWKNVQTIRQLYSSPMLLRLCSKSFKWCFSSTWAENFQMFNLGFDKVEEPEIKLATLTGHRESKGISEKYLPPFHWLC